MQRITKLIELQASCKKLRKRLRKIIDLVKSPEFQFDWPEFMPPATDMSNPHTILNSSLRQLPPNLRRHLRHLANNWGDEWTGRELNSARDVRVEAIQDPLWATLPPQITMFEDGRPIMLVVLRYREIRRWHETLLQIARKQFPVYFGFQVTVDAVGMPVWGRDELSEALDSVNWNYIRECKVCGSVYLEVRLTYKGNPVEPHCGPKCGQRIRQARSPRKPRPPSRLHEARLGTAAYCREFNLRAFPNTKASVQWTSEYTGLRPSTIQKCVNYLESHQTAKRTIK
jgi:hypothetical protein